ncbi:MAG: T9SS type A sorting domain-containing protein [Bacteroides sp.]|nr:T9SS type A sorting domain-containing protein [Bacteroides sp.]
MEIYNAAGAQVSSVYVSAGKRVVELQNAGLYFVKVTAANRTMVKRIIVR